MRFLNWIKNIFRHKCKNNLQVFSITSEIRNGISFNTHIEFRCGKYFMDYEV